jgi:Zn ribbon nucleic-acid-binding protein
MRDDRPSERRVNRLTVPRCPECDSHRTAIVVREEFVLYARCTACAHVWPIPHPGQRLPGARSENE